MRAAMAEVQVGEMVEEMVAVTEAVDVVGCVEVERGAVKVVEKVVEKVAAVKVAVDWAAVMAGEQEVVKMGAGKVAASWEVVREAGVREAGKEAVAKAVETMGVEMVGVGTVVGEVAVLVVGRGGG